MKNTMLYTPIPKKMKNHSNFDSSTSSKSKIETKINNLKKEIGINSISLSRKKKNLFETNSLISNNLDNNIIKSFFTDKFNRNKNSYFLLINYNKIKSYNLKNNILQNNETDLKISKNLFEKFKEIDNFFNKNILSKKQIKKKYYMSRNNLKLNIIKSNDNLNKKRSNKIIFNSNTNLAQKNIMNSLISNGIFILFIKYNLIY